MIHPDLWLEFVRQRQRELWVEAEHMAQVRRLKASSFRRPRWRVTGNPAAVTQQGNDERTVQESDVVGRLDNHRRAA